MKGLNLSHFLVVKACEENRPVFQVVTTITDPELTHCAIIGGDNNYFLDQVEAENFAMLRRMCRFYDAHLTVWSAQAVQNAYNRQNTPADASAGAMVNKK